jgi:hypothetical protein
VHVPEQVISPTEVAEGDLVFIWDQYMKSDVLSNLLNTPVPWSPALIEGYAREWKKLNVGRYSCELVKDDKGRCLGAVLLLCRLKDQQLNPLIEDYKDRGYTLKNAKVLVGDLIREVSAFLP